MYTCTIYIIYIEESCKSLFQSGGKELAGENILTLSVETGEIPRSHPETCFMDLCEE